MSSRVLSNQEKQAIDEILSKAEEEYAQSEPYQSIQAIDQQCKSVWPEWKPPNNTSPPIKITPHKSKDTSPAASHEKPALPATFMAQSPKKETSLYNGSPKPKSIPDFSPGNKTKEHLSTTKFNKNEIKPHILANEIDYLKNEVLDLMGKIKSTVKSPEMSSTAAELLKKVNKSATPQKKLERSATDSFKLIDNCNETPKRHEKIDDILNEQSDELQKQQTDDQLRQQQLQQNQQQQELQQIQQQQQQLQQNIPLQRQPNQQPQEFQLPLRVRTKAQTKSAILAVQREMKELEQENLSLRKQFKELKHSYLESEREIKQLKDALTRSEAIRQKMLSTFGQQSLSIRSDERVHKF